MSQVLFPQPIGLNGYQTLLGSCSDLEQLRVSNGNLVRRYTVASISTVGPTLSLVLTHNSIDNFLHPTMPAGRNWRHIGMANLAFSTNLVSFTDENGRVYDYVPDGSGWKRHDTSLFLPMDLSQVGTEWQLAGLANGNRWIFNAQGQLTSIVDSHNQALSFAYDNNRVTSITEPTGRSLVLAYSNGRLASITAPNNQVTALGYDSNDNLTSITGPEGCQISYGYAPGSTNGLIVSRTDALNNTYSYSYYGNGSLNTVTNPASHSLSYTYQAQFSEFFDNSHPLSKQDLTRTLLTDAHNQVWDYRFDLYQNLWRILDPLQHTQQFYWSEQQKLLFASQGYHFEASNEVSARPHLYNRLQRNVFDSLGNQTLAIDANGLIDEMEYDSQSRLVAMTPGRATLAIGGEWLDHFGKDGFLLCAAQTTSRDVFQRPNYVASQGILNGDDQGQKGFIRSIIGDPEGVPYQSLLHDSRAPWIRLPGDPSRNSYRRSLGKWRTPDTTESEFVFRIPISQTGGFNLSFYTHCLDQFPFQIYAYERMYNEFYGRDLEFTVVDRDPNSGNPRTQTFRLPNTAAGLWVTFSVYQVADSNISVKVKSYAPSELSVKHPTISCIAFDPLDPRRSTLSYEPSTGDLLQWKDPLGQATSMVYNSNGTLHSQTDPKSRQTQFFYEDLHKNLTRILDALGGQTLLSYDVNGNVVSTQDPDGRTTLMEYDGKNRLIRVEDALGHETLFEFDGAGNLSLITDAKGRETRLYYNNLNRLIKIKDPLNQEVLMGYDATGRLSQVTDALGRLTQFSYDAAGRQVETLLPDQQKVLMAYNAIDRLVAITSPNGARSNWEQIQLTGSLNVLDNPSIEIESTGAAYPNRPQRWNHSEDWINIGGSLLLQSSDGPNPKPKPRCSTEAHSGSYSLELVAEQDWSQREIQSFAGGRYLARGWAKKAATGAATVVTNLAGVVRNFQAELEVQETPGQETSVATTWTDLKPQLIQVPGDSQASRTHPPLARLELRCEKSQASDPSTPTYFDDLSLSLLNTCMQYDGNNLREVTTPDGARFVRDFDRFGRLSRLTDPQGRSVSFHYDSLDRLIRVEDSLGHSLLYGYDPVGQMISFTDARGQVMTFGFDALDRLESITYPDSTSEIFTYSPAGDLLSYRDNLNRLRSFGYDFIHRLILITYPNTQTLGLAYDEVGNLTQRTERNGDQELYSYDALDRPTGTRLIPAPSSPSQAWQLQSEFDAVGNRTRLSKPGAAYGVGKYGQDHYRFNPYWSVPNGGFDSMNRLVTYLDSRGNSNQMSYDVEGRRTQLAPSNGTLTSAAYDIVGKLLSLTTSKNSQELLRLTYDYNQASDRLAQQSDKASCTYHLDQAGRLVQETSNRWVTEYSEHLAQGELESCLLDGEAQRIQLLGVSDNFSKLQLDRWTIKFQEKEWGYDNLANLQGPVVAPPQHTGMRLRADQGLHMLYPSAWMTVNLPARDIFKMVRDEVGNLYQRSAIQNLELKRTLTGDFDLVLEWDGFDIPVVGSNAYYDPLECFLKVAVEPVAGGSYWLQRGFERNKWQPPLYPNTYQWSYNSPTTTEFKITNPMAHQTGKFRFKRTGDAFELFYWDAPDSNWELCSGAPSIGFPTGEVNLSISGICNEGSLQFRLISLTHLGANPLDFPTSFGRYTSLVYDAGQSVPWNRLSWEETLPANSDVQVQVACSNSPEGPWTYRGPDGTSNTFFTTPAGEALPVGANFTSRYARFRVTLTSNGLATPSFGNLHLSFGGSGMIASSCRNYRYDPAGNLQTVTTVTDSGTTVDDRNPAANPINSLNQIKGRTVGGVTWTYSYDLNGNLVGKTNGTATWTYTWNDENRLTRVQGPGVDVSYTYDSIGRMLSRSQSGVVTGFTWDGWTCVREVTAGANTVYHIPDGTLHSFVVGGKVYQCHLDALGSVRMITDEAGAVAARWEYGAWGEEVFASVSPVLAGFAYRFVGGLGVRTDSVTGLVYMRNRWYDPGLMRFVSRDPIGLKGGTHLYRYVINNPTKRFDPTGLRMRVKSYRIIVINQETIVFERDGCHNERLKKLFKRYYKLELIIEDDGTLHLPEPKGPEPPWLTQLRNYMNDSTDRQIILNSGPNWPNGIGSGPLGFGYPGNGHFGFDAPSAGDNAHVINLMNLENPSPYDLGDGSVINAEEVGGRGLIHELIEGAVNTSSAETAQDGWFRVHNTDAINAENSWGESIGSPWVRQPDSDPRSAPTYTRRPL